MVFRRPCFLFRASLSVRGLLVCEMHGKRVINHGFTLVFGAEDPDAADLFRPFHLIFRAACLKKLHGSPGIRT